MKNLIKRKVIRSGTLLWLTALAALLHLFGSSLYAATPLDEVTFSPDVTVVLGGETVNDEDAAADDLAGTVTPVDLGTLPGATDLNAYHLLATGERLLSFDTTVVLDGVTVAPGDVVRVSSDGLTYTVEFDASDSGLPDGVITDAVSIQNGELLVSFDTTVSLDGFTADDEDLVSFDGSTFSLVFDGSAKGVAQGLDLDGAHSLSSGNILLSFDGSGTVDSVSFDDEDVLEYDPNSDTWELAYDGDTQHVAWSAADLDALHSRVILIVSVDIKPGSDPNCIKDNYKGRLTIAILASSEYDVTSIDESTIVLEGGIPPIHTSLNKDVNEDGFPDLVLQFDKADLEGLMLADGDTLTITGETTGGQGITGADVIYFAGGPNCFD